VGVWGGDAGCERWRLMGKPWLHQGIDNRMRPLISWPPGINFRSVLVRESRSSPSSWDESLRAIPSSRIPAINLSVATRANTNPNPGRDAVDAPAKAAQKVDAFAKSHTLFASHLQHSYHSRTPRQSHVLAKPAIRMAAPRISPVQVTSSPSTNDHGLVRSMRAFWECCTTAWLSDEYDMYSIPQAY
jgi:hypothetical protein